MAFLFALKNGHTYLNKAFHFITSTKEEQLLFISHTYMFVGAQETFLEVNFIILSVNSPAHQ